MSILKEITLVLFCLRFTISLSQMSKCNADVVVAGLFPIRSSTESLGGKLQCNGQVSSKGIQEALAMVFAIDKVNNNKSLLPNITLGVDLKDSCDNNEMAISSCLQYNFVQQNSHLIGYHTQAPTVAVIGLRKSSISKTVSTITNLFKVPAISYGSTDHVLSSPDIYPTFARTIPSDLFLSKALIQLIRKLQWNIIYVVYDNSDYGLSSYLIFQQHVDEINKEMTDRAKRICIAVTYEFKEFIRDLKTIKNKWSTNFEIKSIVLFVHREKGSELLQNVFYHNLRYYTWIFSEGINYSLQIKKMVQTSTTGNHVISIQLKEFCSQEYQNFVENYFFTKELSDLIPGLKECRNKRNTCLQDVPEFSYFIPYVIDAVNVIAHALHKGYECKSNESCTVRTMKRSLMDHILNVSFKSELGYHFEFTKYGDVLGQYEIFHLQEKYQATNPKQLMNKIGLFDSKHENNITLNVPIWTFTRSSCYFLCPEGFGLVARKEFSQCCSRCVLCGSNKYTSNITFKCETCKSKFEIPNTKQSGCTDMKHNTITYNSKVGIALISVSTIGVVIVLTIMIIFIAYRTTHIVRASSVDLSLLMLTGCLIGFTSSHLSIGQINTLTCRVSVIVSGFVMSLIVGTLFIKTNRIYRIFSKRLLNKGIRFMSRKSQLTIVSLVTLFDCILSIIVIYFPSDPVVYERIIHPKDKETYASCKYAPKTVAIWWLYNALLILLCTYQAVLARNVPDNYNEARNILFSMMAIALEIFFLVPGFYYSTEDSYIQLIYSVVNTVAATSTVCFMFLPKIYLVLFRPWENKEKLPHGTLGQFRQSEIIDNHNTQPSSPCRQSEIIHNHNTQPSSPCKKRKLNNNTAVAVLTCSKH